ncbi:WcaG Nucleoside-diphosphate-sugar epimerases [uncultured Caudovirales phage]|uniref:WcaG Nucleoside-diphosphate-sugar epimerases n=1 Tax=uncultured Caudovirales phage TaxID=2100421 RepID=A0A6J5Q1C4_9CAUD|nr:WcaG Nucleoside-diphosphate-sugar epimerases [uncultured Caudovirales phage]CAB4210438.1 WcaG Nucleoside-diphosphate-sugar epimerases [uncultured Caudovirales phage]CAB4223485.1 WcaG Nucleoside-diphosphate-sugar epimerases [uncultured Caudovirales phage]
MLDVVTGGAGFIGSHLVDRLLADGRKVRVVDNFCTGREKNLQPQFIASAMGKLETFKRDIRQKHEMEGAFDGADRVFHLAALADIVPSIENPRDYYDTNVTGTFNVMEEARRAGVKKVIYAASSSCYGIPDEYPTSEDSYIFPQYPYATTKDMGEDIVCDWRRYYGIQTIALRLFNVYGPRSRTTGAYGAMFGVFMAQLLAKKPLTVVGDGEQSRDFTYVTDVADAFCAAADSRHTGVFNIGTGKPVTVNEIVKLLGAKKVVHIPKRPGEPDKTQADVTKANNQLGWYAKTSIEDGVQKILERKNDWSGAPVWTPETIATATKAWFKHLA